MERPDSNKLAMLDSSRRPLGILGTRPCGSGARERFGAGWGSCVDELGYETEGITDREEHALDATDI